MGRSRSPGVSTLMQRGTCAPERAGPGTVLVALCFAAQLAIAASAEAALTTTRVTSVVDSVVTLTIPITVLPPSFAYFNLLSGAPENVESAVLDSLGTFVVQVACETLDRAALICAGPRTQVVEADTTELQRFISQSERNVAARDLQSWSSLLESIAAGDTTRLILIQHFRVKTGHKPSLMSELGLLPIFFEDDVGHVPSNTLISTALVECHTGRVIRRVETLVRFQPNPGAKQFVEALHTTYGKFR
jgi:hypothetical protein